MTKIIKDLCKFCKKEIIDGLKVFVEGKPVAHYSCFRKTTKDIKFNNEQKRY